MTDLPAIPSAEAEKYCAGLMSMLKEKNSLDLESEHPDPLYSTAPLFSENRGQMFGILVCRNKGSENPLILKAFSGQYNGIWTIPGWVPPVLSPEAFYNAVRNADPPIKQLTAEIDLLKQKGTAENKPLLEDLIEKRSLRSQAHMREIHSMYVIRNFKGEQTDLFSIFDKNGKGSYSIPAGTGDCCAPKLLNEAIIKDLVPISLAEFFWGRENRSGSKQHGRFYPPCSDKCVPLLGFMLQGTEFSGNHHA